MSAEDVATVKRNWEAWTRGDLHAMFGGFGPEVEWDTTNFEGWPDEPVYRGHEGIRRFLTEWEASWESFEAGAQELIELDDHRVLLLCWQRVLGARSKVPLLMEYAILYELAGGLITRMEVFSDRAAAREAVGLGAESP
jgi:ketosteroid isomerase-like protein